MFGILFEAFLQRQRALINFTAPPSGKLSDLGDRVLQRQALQRIAKKALAFADAHLRRRFWWGDHDDDLAARFVAGARFWQTRQFAAPDLLMELGQFAAQGGLAVGAEAGGQIGQSRGAARPAFEQHEGCRNWSKFGNARTAGCWFGRQKAREKKLIGWQP